MVPLFARVEKAIHDFKPPDDLPPLDKQILQEVLDTWSLTSLKTHSLAIEGVTSVAQDHPSDKLALLLKLMILVYVSLSSSTPAIEPLLTQLEAE
jgi:hypothetical protein